MLNNPLAISPTIPRKRAKHSLTTKLTSGKEFMEKMETKIERVWNRAEIIVFECLVQLLSSSHIALSCDNVQRYFNKIVLQIDQLGYTAEIVEKSLDEIRLQIRAHDEALKGWLNGMHGCAIHVGVCLGTRGAPNILIFFTVKQKECVGLKLESEG